MSRKLTLVVVALIAVNVVVAFAAANSVTGSKAEQFQSGATTANDLKPAECAALNLTAIVAHPSVGGAAAELVLGTNSGQTLSAGGGNDCLVAGGGNDTLDGGTGTDVCLGGSGVDTYQASCETSTDSDGCVSPGNQTVVTNKDSYISQAAPSENKGTDSNLFVTSKSGSQNQRSLVGFTLPTLPSGCVVTSATLRVFNNSPSSGSTIQAIRITGSWTETGVTWSNQPATTGTAATSVTGSSSAYQSWTVTTQVQEMYTNGHNSFLLRDATENSASERKQNYKGRENGTSTDADLLVNWG